MTSFSEGELFALYWLQYFVVPMHEESLVELWRMRRQHSPGEDGTLPIDKLVEAGLVLRERGWRYSIVSLVRSAFTADQFRTVLQSVVRYDWRFPTSKLAKSWANLAFPAESEEKLALWHGHRADGIEILRAAQLLHVFVRWGLRAMELFSGARHFNRDTVYIGDMHGNDVEDDARVRKALRDSLKGDFHTHEQIALKELKDDLTFQYETFYRTRISFECCKLLMPLAERSADALRRGQAVCGKEEESVLLALLAVRSFRAGEDVGVEVHRLEELSRQIVLKEEIANLVFTLAFWRGERDVVKKLIDTLWNHLTSPDYGRVLLMALDGDLAMAAKRLGGAVGLPTMMGGNFSAIGLPFLLTLLVIWSKAKNNRTAIKRLDRYIDEVYRSYFGGPGADDERRWVRAHIGLSVDKYWKADKSQLAQTARPGVPSWLRTTLALSGAEDTFAHLSRDGQAELEVVSRWLGSGYLTMAADAVAEIRGATNVTPIADRVAEVADKVASLGGVAVIGPRACLAPWEKALDAIETSVLGARKDAAEADAITQGRIAWCWHVYNGTEAYVDLIGAVYIGVRKDGDEKRPVRICEARLLSGAYDAVMTEEDIQIRNELAGSRILREKPSARHETPTLATLRLFENVKDLRILITRFRVDDNFGEAMPVRLAFGNIRASVTADADGGVRISAGRDGFFRYQRSYAIEPDPVERDLWHVDAVSSSYLEIQAVIHKFAPEGTIVIPREGLERVERMLARSGRTAPIAWSLRAANGPNDVRRIPAEARACVRLRYGDGTLSAHLVVRLSDSPEWTSESSMGMPERLVVCADGSKEMIVRDFAAEEKAVEAVRKILSELDSSQSGTNRWSFDGAEESLDALAALHEAEKTGAFALEWPDGKRLDLASVVAHSATFSGGETADYWLSVSGEFKLDDGKVLAFADLLKNFDAREGAYVKLTDARYLKLSAALARRVEALKGAGFERRGEFVIPPAALPSLEKTVRETEADDYLPLPEIVAERIGKIRDAFAATPPMPRVFKGTMRPYQEDGYRWLSRLSDCGIGACLADDMGLGKTIQLIALLAAQKANGPSLVIAPASVAFNWRNEFARFAPALKVALVGQTPGAQEEDVGKIVKGNDVVVTSYGVAASRLAAFAPVSWNVLVLDEAQAIKNHLTQRAKSVKELKARFRVAATGTPVENRLTELWSIFDFLNPGMLGGETRFAKELAPHGEATPRLKRLVKPLILRRIKRDVLTDLPEKEEITVPVVLGVEERHAYEATRVAALAKLHGGDPQNKIAILAELTRLRRFCCHPSLVMPSVQAGAKLEALERLLAGLKENGHRALVFSQFVDFLAIVRKLLEKNGWSYEYLDGATSKADREKSVGRFQNGDGDFFLISLKAGGMGLNLTAANYVILLDPWWNPAVENQAADRVHRIGQRLPVTVYRLIAQDTIEEKVVNLHAKKTALAEDILASGASALSAEAMLDLLEGRL